MSSRELPTASSETDTRDGALELHDVVMPVLLKVLALAAEHGRWGTVDAVLAELKARRDAPEVTDRAVVRSG